MVTVALRDSSKAGDNKSRLSVHPFPPGRVKKRRTLLCSDFWIVCSGSLILSRLLFPCRVKSYQIPPLFASVIIGWWSSLLSSMKWTPIATETSIIIIIRWLHWIHAYRSKTVFDPPPRLHRTPLFHLLLFCMEFLQEQM